MMKLKHLFLSKGKFTMLLCWVFMIIYQVPVQSEVPDIEEISLEEAFERIGNSYGVFFNYDQEMVSDMRVSYNPDEYKDVNEALISVFEQTDLMYQIFDERYVAVYRETEEGVESIKKMIDHFQGIVDRTESEKKRKVELVQRLRTYSIQEIYNKRLVLNVSGTVTDQNGEPLIGVNVLVKGTNQGTATDFEGRFTLEDVDENAVLVVSYIGYQTQEVVVAGKSSLRIILVSDAQMLEEVVVVGYGVKKEANLLESVSQIKGDKLDSRPATTIASLMQGEMAGVAITQRSGQPGEENPSILIRGTGTMNNNSPLIVVDGLVVPNMGSVSPNDIESISVLKDAAGASIYGSRAANGVIIITTKRSDGTSRIEYNAHLGKQSATRIPQYLSSYEYAKLLNEALANDGIPPQYTQEDLEKFRSGDYPYTFPNTNWMDLMLNGSGFIQNHNLSISGGNEASSYRISGTYNDQNGLMKKTEAKEYGLLVNVDSKVNEKLDMGLNLKLSRENILNPVSLFGYSTGVGQFFRQANRIPPIVPNKFEDGSWGRHDDGNPIAWQEDGGQSLTKNSNLSGSIFGELEFIDGLSLEGMASIHYGTGNTHNHFKVVSYGGGSKQGPNVVEQLNSHSLILSLQSTLRYRKELGKNFINGLIGISRRQNTVQYLSAYRENFPNNTINELGAGSETGMRNDGSKIESKLGSYFTRVDYRYDDRYLFQANLRYDGSSKFASEQRWGLFPSFAAGWRVNEESFMEEINWLSQLKLRVSWGQLGNNRISDYSYLPLISLGQNYPFGGVVASGAAQTASVNPFVTWETTSELNIGVDMSFLGNKFYTTLEYYNKHTYDILATIPVAMAFGLPAPPVNAGEMSNKGFEFLAGYNSQIGDFQYNISFNGAYNKNEVLKFQNPSIGGRIIKKEGIAWNSYYGLINIGKFESKMDIENSPHRNRSGIKVGDLKFKDQNGDGIINGDDRVVLGNRIPKFTFGLNLGGGFRGFSISAFLQGANDVSRVLGNEAMWPFVLGNKAQKMHLDRTIVEDGKIIKQGNYPIFHVGSNASIYEFSTFNVLDASYIRLKNIQLSYTFPSSLINRLKISNLRLYLSAENLLLFTRNYPNGYDPEMADGNNTYYPQVKSFILGLNITL